MQVKKVVDAVKQEKKATRGNVGKENLDENVDDPPPALPVKPARAAKKLPQAQVLATFKFQMSSLNLVFSGSAKSWGSCGGEGIHRTKN